MNVKMTNGNKTCEGRQNKSTNHKTGLLFLLISRKLKTANEINGTVEIIIESFNESNPTININPIKNNKLLIPSFINKLLGCF
jgi:hypothetical protein